MACDTPTWIKLEKPKFIAGNWQYAFPADCGKCLMCLRKRKAQWSYRLMEEKQHSFSSYFVTLTYNNKFVPYGEFGYCANKNDHTEFIKWLNYYEDPQQLSERKEISMEEHQRSLYHVHEYEKLRYFGCIEYGDLLSRPHWHYILFNVVDIANINRAWSSQLRISKGVYQPNESKGKIDIQKANVNTIDYVLKYMLKHEGEKQKHDREEERSFMSKGLGLRAATPELIRHISLPHNNQVGNSRGIKVALPRIFKKKFLTDEENAAKQKFTIQMALQAKKEKEDNILRQKRDPEKVRISAIEARSQVLKNRKRRNTE